MGSEDRATGGPGADREAWVVKVRELQVSSAPLARSPTRSAFSRMTRASARVVTRAWPAAPRLRPARRSDGLDGSGTYFASGAGQQRACRFCCVEEGNAWKQQRGTKSMTTRTSRPRTSRPCRPGSPVLLGTDHVGRNARRQGYAAECRGLPKPLRTGSLLARRGPSAFSPH